MSTQTAIATLYAMRQRLPAGLPCIDEAINYIRCGHYASALDCVSVLAERPMPEMIRRNMVQIRAALVAASGEA
jgi:hypothetical protein